MKTKKCIHILQINFHFCCLYIKVNKNKTTILTFKSPEILAPASMPVAAGKKMANTEMKVLSSVYESAQLPINESKLYPLNPWRQERPNGISGRQSPRSGGKNVPIRKSIMAIIRMASRTNCTLASHSNPTRVMPRRKVTVMTPMRRT